MLTEKESSKKGKERGRTENYNLPFVIHTVLKRFQWQLRCLIYKLNILSESKQETKTSVVKKKNNWFSMEQRQNTLKMPRNI